MPDTRLIPIASRGPVGRTVEGAVHRLLGLPEFQRLYDRARSVDRPDSFFASALEALGIGYQVTDEDRGKIPVRGPVILVANHPFGGVDGLILADILDKARPDFRLLVNGMLIKVPELRTHVIPVDPYRTPDAARANVRSMRDAIRWLRTGGALGVFPSGTVSHLRLGAGVSDPPWHPNVAALARLCGATVVPVFFDGRNSMFFQVMGLLHPSLRTALLPSELLKRRHSVVRARVGRPLEPSRFDRYPADEDLIQYLRFKTYSLRRRRSPVRLRFPAPKRLLDADRAPVIPAVPSLALETEIRALPSNCLLHRSGDYEVYIADAQHMPRLLLEIGRLREETFRAVDEGTGEEVDLDRFDRTYQHLFLWNRKASELVGSYRIGRADALLADAGVAGLYTNTLFKFGPDFITRLGPALEMGRSFIRREYQRKPTTLALLWRGIGAYLCRHPAYKVLFGPVSINQSYESNSLRLLLEYLRREHGDHDLRSLVKAKNPPQRERMDDEERVALDRLVDDEDDVSHLIADIEKDNKGMPVLLRYYLRLGARVLSFNVDPAFGNCVDGLIVVDLRHTDPKLLKRFMGDEGHAAFAAHS